MTRIDRRPMIADAALELAASGGNHGVSHLNVDRQLELPKGSSSYYFRTREALIAAMVERLILRSREAFEAALEGGAGDPVSLIGEYLDELVTVRRADCLARTALLAEPGLSGEVRNSLARCFFSVEAATALAESRGAADPEIAANQLVTVLEGLVFTYTVGLSAHPAPEPGSVAGKVQPLVAAVLPRDDRPAPGLVRAIGRVRRR